MKKILILLLMFGWIYAQSDLGREAGEIKMQNIIVDAEETTTSALKTIGFPHAKIHDGMHYNIGLTFSLGSGDTSHVVFDVGDTTQYSHMFWDISSTVGATITIREGGAYVRSPDAITAINNNRNSSNVTVMDTIFAVYQDSTLWTRAGTLLTTHTLGANQKSGGSLGREAEWIMKNDSLLDFRILSNAGSNVVDLNFEWYEHTSDE